MRNPNNRSLRKEPYEKQLISSCILNLHQVPVVSPEHKSVDSRQSLFIALFLLSLWPIDKVSRRAWMRFSGLPIEASSLVTQVLYRISICALSFQIFSHKFFTSAKYFPTRAAVCLQIEPQLLELDPDLKAAHDLKKSHN